MYSGQNIYFEKGTVNLVEWGENEDLLPLRILDKSKNNIGPVGDINIKKKEKSDKRASNDIEKGWKRETLSEDKVESLA